MALLNEYEQWLFRNRLVERGFIEFDREVSADGVPANSRINIERALIRENHKDLFINVIQAISKYFKSQKVEAITGVPFAGMLLAEELAWDIGKKTVGMSLDLQMYPHRQAEFYSFKKDQAKMLSDYQTIGVIQGVSTDNSEFLQIERLPELADKRIVAVSVIRRGLSAPIGFTPLDVKSHNLYELDQPPYELRTRTRVESVVDFPLPPFLREDNRVEWLPE